MSALAKLTQAKLRSERSATIPALGDGRRRMQRADDALRSVAAVLEVAAQTGCQADGDNQRLLEQRLRARLEVPAVVGVSTPGAALRGVLELLELPPGSEVIMPALGTITAPFAVSDAFAVDTDGRLTKPALVPVFTDVDPRTYTLSPAAAEAAITDKTRAIVAAHLFGQPAEMRPLKHLAAAHGLALIEDVSHGLGGHSRDVQDDHDHEVGSLADFACLSPAGVGVAGAVAVTQSGLQRVPRAASRLRAWRELGRDSDARLSDAWGLSAGMNHCAAAHWLAELTWLDGGIARRTTIAARYRAALTDELGAPTVRPECRHAYDVYAVRTPSLRAAENLRAHLAAAAIGTREPCLLPSEHPVYKTGRLPCRLTNLRAAPTLAQTLVTLPCYQELTDTEIERIELALQTYKASNPPVHER